MTKNTDPAIAAARLGDQLSSIAGQMSTVSEDFAALATRLAADSSLAAKTATAKAPVAEPASPVEATKKAPAAPAPTPTPIRQMPPTTPPTVQQLPPQVHRQQPMPTATYPQPRLQYATAVPGPPAGATQAPFGGQPPNGPWTPTPMPQHQMPQNQTSQHQMSQQQTRRFSERLAEAVEHGLVGRVLAAVGVGITLIGVVMLLILAAQAGLLRPEIRVAGGALFAAALVAIGCRIGRREEKRSGALALVATGTATALFDVLAATSIYHWLPEIAALILGGAIGAGGLWVAHRWESQTLGLMVSIPMLVFAPVVSGGVDALLVCFMLVYAASTLGMQAGRDWLWLFVVNTVATTLPMFVFAAIGSDADPWFVVLAGLINLTLALGSAIVLSSSSSRSVVLGLVSTIAGAPLLALGGSTLLNRPTATAAIALGGLLFALAALGTRGRISIPFACRVVWLSGAAVFAALALGVALQGDALALGFLAAAIVMVVGVRWAADLAEAMRVISAIFAAVGLVTLLAIGGLEQLLAPSSADSADQATLLVGALLGLAAATLLTYEFGEYRPAQAQQTWLIGGVIDLWLITELCISIGNLATDGSVGGFRAGHLAATLVWFGAGAAALMWARTVSGTNRTMALATGLAVIAAAVAKLFLFDLAALAGVFRVIAFIVAGLVLLSLGVAYAQSIASDEKEAQPVGPAPQ